MLCYSNPHHSLLKHHSNYPTSRHIHCCRMLVTQNKHSVDQFFWVPIRAAGVLPYAKDSKGNTWFLLGREKPNSNWGIDSASWSEFGGSLNKGETVEDGAAREFFEETMGSIFGNKAWIANELKSGRYLFVMDSRTPSSKGYRSFVKEIPFADYPTKFARYRTLAKKQPDLLEKLCGDCFEKDSKLHQSCTEKTSIAWFSMDQMRLAVEKYQKLKSQNNLQTRARNNRCSYYEKDMIPHIRRGFAMDFDHLLGTSWGISGFTEDIVHFPLTFSPEELSSLVRTNSGLKSVIRTPRYWGDSPTVTTLTKEEKKKPKPPVVVVNIEGYSFKKKKKKKRNNSQWIMVESKKSSASTRNRTLSFSSYKPKPPDF